MDFRRTLVGAVGGIGLMTAALAMMGPTAALAQWNYPSSRAVRRPPPAQERLPAQPVLAIVSLSDQHVTIYDASGKALQSPVSTGATGYETPAGIFTVVQKKEMHQSNLYEDGTMPFMQRITWTGIALHAGVLPGYPASHGCIRLPIAFAERLFGLTEMGLRVVIVRDDIAPMEIAHPNLFMPDATYMNTAAGSRSNWLDTLRTRAASLSAEAEAATRRARDAKQQATRKTAEAAAAARTVRTVEADQAAAEKTLKDAERTLETPTNPPKKLEQAELTKAKAQERLRTGAAQLQLAKEQAGARQDAAARAGEEVRAAENAATAATEAASAAARKLQPFSIFISRKAQRLYIRQANEPVYEGPVSIRDADKAIGTFVFTAVGDAGQGSAIRWNVVSMYRYSENAEPAPQPPRRKGEARNASPIPADVAAAKAALDRIAIPREVLAELSGVVLPGSSLIVSDEAASIETGKDTDFVVVMSGEPQGALKIRQREPLMRSPYDDDYYGNRKSKGFPFFIWN